MNDIQMIDNCLTNGIELRTQMTNSSHKKMEKSVEKFISVREFIRNFSSNIQQNNVYIITKNGIPIGKYSPYQDSEPKFLTKEEITKFISKNSTAPKDLSENHDKYLYSKD